MGEFSGLFHREPFGCALLLPLLGALLPSALAFLACSKSAYPELRNLQTIHACRRTEKFPDAILWSQESAQQRCHHVDSGGPLPA